jgi:hypothetical protein
MTSAAARTMARVPSLRPLSIHRPSRASLRRGAARGAKPRRPVRRRTASAAAPLDRLLRALAVGVVLASSGPAAAHHSVLRFDGSRPVTLAGVVAEVVWRDPHAYIVVDAAGGRGRWIVESESPVVLQRLGWTRASIRRGDAVTTTGAAATDGARIMRCQFVAVAKGDRLPCYPAGA